MPSETLTCALGIGADTLSAWRDELLPREERDRLRVHVAECAVCGRRLAELDEVARVLRAQRELEPGNRIGDEGERTAAELDGFATAVDIAIIVLGN